MTNESMERSNAERIFARGFTVLGGIFWTVSAFAGPYVFAGKSAVGAFGIALYPLLFTIGVLVLGLFNERYAALALALSAIGTVAWGVIMGWAAPVWAIMLIFFVAPAIVASLLYYLAGSTGETRMPVKTVSHRHALS